jgi:LysM repeat protein
VAQIADAAVVPAPRPSAPQVSAAPALQAGLGVQPAPRATGGTATRGTGTVGGASPRPAATPTTARPAGGKSHTVAAKDTLYSIARRYGVRVEDIVAANRAAVPSVNTPLKVGTVLKIP